MVDAALASLSPPVRAPLGTVRTARLELRPLRDIDLDALATLFADEAVWRFPYGRGLTRKETATFLASQRTHWDALGFGLWLVTGQATGRVIGVVGLSVPTFFPEILPAVEVGWRLDPSAWGQGYATEAGAAALREAFTTLGLEEVCSLPQTGNAASIAVARRLGLRLARPVTVPASTRRGPVEALLFTVSKLEWRPPEGIEQHDDRALAIRPAPKRHC